MEATNIILQRYNLTGQVSIVDTMPKFSGNYSTVFRGAFDDQFVAVKVIKATRDQKISTVQRKLLREVTVWGSTSHPNIYPFYGYANDPEFGPFGALISPWCSNGDACQHLTQKGKGIAMAEQINLWKGVIEGVVYLHTRIPPIVHGDLKPGNVLIDDAGKPRICDFGLARIFLHETGSGMTTTSEHTGTPRYLAPELVTSETTVPPTRESDVYALGCLGLEFVYLQQPHAKHPNNTRGQIFQDLRRGIPPAIEPPHSIWPSHRIWQLMKLCWSHNPLSRPSARETALAVKSTTLTLPAVAVQKVIRILDVGISPECLEPEWATRIKCLHALCLVSRAYCTWATPSLYRIVWLDRDASKFVLSALNYAMHNSVMNPLLFNWVNDGYGTYTEHIIITRLISHYPLEALATEICDVIHMMPRLRSATISSNDHPKWPDSSNTLTKLLMDSVDISLLLSTNASHQVFSRFRCLYLHECYGRAGSDRSLATSLDRFLPNLQFLEVYVGYEGSPSKILDALSTRLLPCIQDLRVRGKWFADLEASLKSFLQSHGAVLRYLCLSLSELPRDMSTTICALCPNIRHLKTDCWSIFDFEMPSSHPTLQILSIRHYNSTLVEYCVMLNLRKLESLARVVSKIFPSLVKVEIVEAFFDWTVSFRPSDDFITVKRKDRDIVERHYLPNARQIVSEDAVLTLDARHPFNNVGRLQRNFPLDI